MTSDDFKTDAEIKVKESDIFPCPSCGGNMHFNPDTQALNCEYCGGTIDIDSSSEDIKEYDFEAGEELCSTDWGSKVRVIHCDNCGAETVLDSNNTAQHCAFCDSSHIVNIDEIPGIRPESLVPFKISSNNAKEKFSTWLKGKFFAPKELKSNHQIDHLTGVYIPYWTYDAKTNSLYKGEKGTYYYVNQTVWVTRNGKRVAQTRRVRKTRWQYTSGVYNALFDDELIHGSQRLDTLLTGDLGSFDLRELVEYRPEYLSGFVAEKYTIGLKEGWSRAKEKIKSKVRQGVTRKIGGDEVRNLRINTSYDDITYKHILLPLWISAYTYKGKVYEFIINGQSGRVHGKSPVSVPKIIGVTLLSITAIMAIWGLIRLF